MNFDNYIDMNADSRAACREASEETEDNIDNCGDALRTSLFRLVQLHSGTKSNAMHKNFD